MINDKEIHLLFELEQSPKSRRQPVDKKVRRRKSISCSAPKGCGNTKLEIRPCEPCKVANNAFDNEAFETLQKPAGQRRLKAHRRCSTGQWGDELVPFRCGDQIESTGKHLTRGNERINISFNSNDGLLSEHSSLMSSTTGQTSLSSFLSHDSENKFQGDDSLSVVCISDEAAGHSGGGNGSSCVFQLPRQDENICRIDDIVRRDLGQPKNRSRRHVTPAQKNSATKKSMSAVNTKNERASSTRRPGTSRDVQPAGAKDCQAESVREGRSSHRRLQTDPSSCQRAPSRKKIQSHHHHHHHNNHNEDPRTPKSSRKLAVAQSEHQSKGKEWQ